MVYCGNIVQLGFAQSQNLESIQDIIAASGHVVISFVAHCLELAVVLWKGLLVFQGFQKVMEAIRFKMFPFLRVHLDNIVLLFEGTRDGLD